MKKLYLILFFAVLFVTSVAQKSNISAPPIKHVKVGDALVNIPAPDTSFIEISNDHRGLVELFVPQSNRLLSAYVLRNELPNLLKDGSENNMSQYALVEIPRKGEYMDFDSSDFTEIVNGMKKEMDVGNSFKQETEDDFIIE